MNHGCASAGHEAAAMCDAEHVLRAAIIGVKAFGVDVQMAIQMIDIFF
jgi:hypothetical protein